MATKGMTVSKYKARARRTALAFKRKAEANEHTATAAVTAFAMGAAEKRYGKLWTPHDKIDHKLLYAGVVLAGSRYVKNERMKRIAGSVADGLVAIYAYSAAKTGDFGVGEIPEDEDLEV